jgi:hypothetical protein
MPVASSGLSNRGSQKSSPRTAQNEGTPRSPKRTPQCSLALLVVSGANVERSNKLSSRQEQQDTPEVRLGRLSFTKTRTSRLESLSNRNATGIEEDSVSQIFIVQVTSNRSARVMQVGSVTLAVRRCAHVAVGRAEEVSSGPSCEQNKRRDGDRENDN